MAENSTYCSLAHNGLFCTTQGKVAQCCVQEMKYFDIPDWKNISNFEEYYKTDPKILEVRNALDNGIKHPACERCWHSESTGSISKRLRHQKQTDLTVSFLDLRLTNKCNLKCKMCNPNSSDQWVNYGLELEKNVGIDTISKRYKAHDEYPLDHMFELLLQSPNIKQIRFAGGEPFLMPEVETFIHRLVDEGKTDMELDFITNCTTVKPKFIEVLQKFKRVVIGCSIDGVGEEFEYQRYPAKWSSIEKNFKTLWSYKTPAFVVRITPCISILNTLTIDKFLEWTLQFPKLSMSYNEVITPSFQNFRHIPLHVRQDTINRLDKIRSIANQARVDMGNTNHIHDWKNFLEKGIYMYKPMSEQDKKTFKHYALDIWDYKCNTKFLDAYPWAEEVWN